MIGKLKELLKLHSPRRFAGYVVFGVVAFGWISSAFCYNWYFNGGGGTVNGLESYRTNTVTYGCSTKDLVLAHTNRTLKCVGWYNQNYSVKYCSKGGYIEDYQLNSYARWVEDRYPVYFNSNDGKNSITEQSAVKSLPITLRKTSFVRSSHRFGGWSVDKDSKSWTWADGQKDVVLDDYRDLYDITHVDDYGSYTCPVTLYAIWVKQYTLTFDSNGGSGEMPELVLDDGVTTNMPACGFSPPKGRKFLRWSNSKLGDRKPGDEVTFDSSRDEWNGTTSEYKAEWTPISYTVRFDVNGVPQISGTMTDQSVKYGESAKLHVCQFKREGYVFAGWAMSPTGEVAYNDEGDVSNLSDVDGSVVTLYAKWEPVSYRVRFDANGGSGMMDDMMCVYDQGYVLTANAFTREGSDFLGWSTNAANVVVYEDGATVSNLSSVASSTNVLRAVWSNIGYEIAFDANGGKGVMTNMLCEYGSSYLLPSNGFTRTGYLFTGWTTNAMTAAVYAEGESVSNLTTAAEATVRLYAAWRPVTYRIVFDANGGEGAMPPLTNVYDVAVNLPSNAFTRIGKSFAGWSRTSSGEVAFADRAEVLNLKDVDGAELTFFASWGKIVNSLNDALDNSDLIILTDYADGANIAVANDVTAKNKTCVGIDSTDSSLTEHYGFRVYLETPGDLTFRWKVVNEPDQYGRRIGWQMGVTYEDARTSPFVNAFEEGDGGSGDPPDVGEWMDVTVSVTNQPVSLLFWFYQGNGRVGASTPCLYIDNLRWSTGGNPEPEPADAPVINGAASVEGGRFRVSFAADGRFKYELIKTESLSPVNWQSFSPQLFLTPDADGTVSFEPEMESSKPNMFYRVKVLKKD